MKETRFVSIHQHPGDHRYYWNVRSKPSGWVIAQSTRGHGDWKGALNRAEAALGVDVRMVWAARNMRGVLLRQGTFGDGGFLEVVRWNEESETPCGCAGVTALRDDLNDWLAREHLTPKGTQ
jgi:hypothetical protein